MMNDWTKLRLRLLENGYTPLRNRDKACLLKGWPTLAVDAPLVESWARIGRDKATGLRVENGLAVIDVDVQDAAMVNRIAKALEDIVPELSDEAVPWLERHSGKAKVAWFFRTSEVFGRLHTRRWTRPGDNVDDGTQQVEIFGGGHPRQFGAFGPHTVASDGSVLRTYEWSRLSPLDVPLDELPTRPIWTTRRSRSSDAILS